MRSIAAVFSRPRPTATRLLPAALAVAIGLGAASVAASDAAAAVTTGVCTVDTADISWGFKESFRSYISGTIANGEWQTDGGASYATPAFSFTGGTGEFDADAVTGAVAFSGAIHFTGHEGLLQTSVSAPTIEFTGPASARLMLDISSVPMEQALAGDSTVHTAAQVPFVDIDLSGATVTRGSGDVTLTGTDLPTAITAEGFAAFGSYDAGTPFDPITLALHATCAADAPATAAPIPTTDTTAAPTADAAVTTTARPVADSGTAWVPWAVGGGVVVVLAAVGATLAVRRRTGANAASAVAEGGDER